MPDAAALPTARAEPRWHVALCFFLLVVGLVTIGAPLTRPWDWRVSERNPGWLEAVAWWRGRLDLPITTHDPEHARPTDTAWRDGRGYNVYPPLFTGLAYAAIGLEWLQQDLPRASYLPDGFYAPWFVGLMVLPLPLVGFWAFRAACGRSEWAAVFTGYWILGTPLLGSLMGCAEGGIHAVNHVLSNVGLMLIAGDLLGRRRIWPAAVGAVIGLWSRQLTAIYWLAIAWIAWRTWRSTRPAGRGAKFAVAGIALLGAATPLGLNWAKFGNPLDTGYADIYHGRDDMLARRYREHGALFDVRHAPRNLWYMNLALPEAREARGRILLNSDRDGVSIWFTSPLLLFGVLLCRRWWGDPARRALMLCSFGVIGALLCYHTTGAAQAGVFRFALDFAPIWLAVSAPFLIEGSRRWWTCGCLGWSLLYFHLVYSNPP